MAHLKILLVDDDPVQQIAGSESLAADGFDVATEDSGRAALMRLKQERFDLLILDIDMPEMSGLSVLEQVRASDDDATASTPVIMLTGRSDDDSIGKCYDLGANSYIAKPVNWLNMVHQIAFVLRSEENEKGLRAARDAALEMSHAKDMAMMTLRHELRSPLHLIKGFSEVVVSSLGPRLTDEERTSLTAIEGAVGDMSAKMNRVFQYAEILNGDFALTPEFFTARHLISNAVERVTDAAEAKLVKIDVEYPGDAPIELKADEEKLVVCLAELLDNAIAFSPEHATVRVEVLQKPSDGSITIIIEDEGCGLPEEPQTLFEAFVQGDSGLTRSSTGLGIGLTVADAIARHHQGTIELSNRESRGTRAALTIPLGCALAQEAA